MGGWGIATPPPPLLDWPDPPLADLDLALVLRPWRHSDAPVLARAWRQEDLVDLAPGGDDDLLGRARRWIRGSESRLAAGASVDLVVASAASDVVWGEVGAVRRRWRTDAEAETSVWELGWWLLPEHRSQGRAAVAARLLAGWLARRREGPVVARIRDGHLRSETVAGAAGLVCRGRFDEGRTLWVLAPSADAEGEAV